MNHTIKPIRPLEKQFEKLTLVKIRSLQKLLLDFLNVEGGGKYYLKELVSSLEAGLLLSSLHLTLSFMELLTRDLLIYNKAKVGQKPDPNEIDFLEIIIEDFGKPQYTFSLIVDELLKNNVIDILAAELLKKYYQKIRIPLHHGLTRRFVRGGAKIKETEVNDIFEKLLCSKSNRAYRFEEIIEKESIDIITDVIKLLKIICENSALEKTERNANNG